MDLGMEARTAVAGDSGAFLTRVDLGMEAWAAALGYSCTILTGVDLGMEPLAAPGCHSGALGGVDAPPRPRGHRGIVWKSASARVRLLSPNSLYRSSFGKKKTYLFGASNFFLTKISCLLPLLCNLAISFHNTVDYLVTMSHS
jgi:hypothetical protein